MAEDNTNAENNFNAEFELGQINSAKDEFYKITRQFNATIENQYKALQRLSAGASKIVSNIQEQFAKELSAKQEQLLELENMTDEMAEQAGIADRQLEIAKQKHLIAQMSADYEQRALERLQRIEEARLRDTRISYSEFKDYQEEKVSASKEEIERIKKERDESLYSLIAENKSEEDIAREKEQWDRKLHKARIDAIKEEQKLERLKEADINSLAFKDRLKQRADSKKKIAEEKKEKLKAAKEALQANKEGKYLDGRSTKRLEREASEAESEYNKSQMEAWSANVNSQLADSLSDSLAGAMSSLVNAIGRDIDVAMDNFTKYTGSIGARLAGTELTPRKIIDDVKSVLAISPFLRQEKMLENLNSLIEEGIAYNVEDRAFLQTMTDKIATTFDALDKSLTRLVRLQQADITRSRLGMEAQLTEFFNNMFMDTSYLSDSHDTIESLLVEAESQMSRNEATAFEYIVQKWMGSLYSVGVSDTLINNLAQGISYLATGDVSALASNAAIQNLYAMAANRADIDYAKVLVEGLDSETTNNLLKSVVDYLQEITDESKQNTVVKNAFGDVFGATVSDLSAIANNLSSQDISSIYDSTMSYNDAVTKLTDEFTFLYNDISRIFLSDGGYRYTLQELVDNVVSNVGLTIGTNLAESPPMYALWKATNMIEDFTGGIHLPAISIFGNMVDLSAFTIEGIVKMGLVSVGAISSFMDALNSFESGFGFGSDAWEFEEYTTRGSGITNSQYGISNSVSSSAYVTNTSEEDIKSSSISEASEDTDQIYNASEDIEDESEKHTIDDIYELLSPVMDKLKFKDDRLKVDSNATLASSTSNTNNVSNIPSVIEVKYHNPDNDGDDEFYNFIKSMYVKINGEDAGDINVHDATTYKAITDLADYLQFGSI